jgi:hypothetical protein
MLLAELVLFALNSFLISLLTVLVELIYTVLMLLAELVFSY